MELIPILSFIILVATISTFILAIGAYILYKMRERKGRTSGAPAPRYVEAEIFTPNLSVLPQGTPAMNGAPAMQAAGPGYQEQYQRQNPDLRPPVVQPQQQPAQQSRTAAQQSHSRQDFQAQPEDEYNENPTNKKFMKYTSEGYVPVNKTKTGENLKWR